MGVSGRSLFLSCCHWLDCCMVLSLDIFFTDLVFLLALLLIVVVTAIVLIGLV